MRTQTKTIPQRLAATLAAGLLALPAVSLAGSAGALSGAATLIRPELSSLAVTSTQITAISATNIELIAVGQIPIFTTNIAYQLVITNPDVINIFFDTLILTNATGSPFPGGPVGPYFCSDVTVTNIVGVETNVTVIGTACTLSNNPTVLLIATNSLPNIEYYTLITTNLVFDPENPANWQTIYHTNLTITTSIATNTTVTEFNFTFVGSDTARGSVTLEQNGNRQSFSVVGRDLLPDASSPPAALGVFIGDSIFNVNWRHVGIMAKAGTNNLYRLELSSAAGAPPTLGVADVGDLAGMLVQIRDQATNVYAQAVIPKLAAVPKALSFSRTVKMDLPTPTPSPSASGKIRVKYNAETGASYLEVRVKKLAGGNIYCALYTGNPVPDTSGCTDGLTLVNGSGYDRYDTSKGQDLPFGVGNYISTVEDLAGLHLFVVDAFGNIHLSGVIPGP